VAETLFVWVTRATRNLPMSGPTAVYVADEPEVAITSHPAGTVDPSAATADVHRYHW